MVKARRVMKKISWLFLVVVLIGLSVYLIHRVTFDKFLSSDWWRTATVEQVQTEIKNGADVNAKDKNGRTVLDIALYNSEDPRAIKTLLDAGADINGKSVEDPDDDFSEGNDPIVLSCLYCIRNPEIIKVLIDADVKITVDNDVVIGKVGDLSYFLSYFKHHKNAVIDRYVKAMTILGLLDAKESTSGNTALIQIARFKSGIEIAKALIAAGANVNATNKDGDTALMDGALFRNPEIVKVLIAAGADVNAKDGRDKTVLMHSKDNKITEMLIAAGADVNAKDKYGYTALMYAVANGYPEIVKALLAAGADVNAKDRYGKTALTRAKEGNNQEIAAILVKAGAK